MENDDNRLTINVIANAIVDAGTLSGGDRIFIECVKRWAKKRGNTINIFSSEKGLEMCQRQGLDNVNFIILPSASFDKFGLFILYILRTLTGCVAVTKIAPETKNETVYSSSDFWPDSIPAFVMKLRNRNAKWVAGFYLFAPKPWRKDSPYKGKRFLRGLFYYLTQLPIYWIAKRYADVIFVTSEQDVEKFIAKGRGKDKIVVVHGGVDIRPSTEYLNSGRVISEDERKYDACFVGRFHPQKGLLKLIDIWKLVCKEKPHAKLAIIGRGFLEGEVRKQITKFKLNANIELLGFKDGEEKYEIFKQSKIVIHPATYDSGGMAACEAMAWGLPGVSFDLEALKTYYPKGVLKAPCFDLSVFAEKIITLLENKELYRETRENAIVWAREWDWDKRAREILETMKDS